jgi:16S rRNA (uracil1498-N3)-methyltransferase
MKTGTLRAAVGSLSAGERELEPAIARYLVRVHRLRVGDVFVAFDPEAGVEADAELLTADKRVRVRIGAPRPARVTAPLPVTLLWALGKGDKPESVIRDATALGVASGPVHRAFDPAWVNAPRGGASAGRAWRGGRAPVWLWRRS